MWKSKQEDYEQFTESLLVFVYNCEDSLHGSRCDTRELLFLVANHRESKKSQEKRKDKLLADIFNEGIISDPGRRRK